MLAIMVYPSILTGRDVQAFMKSARPKVLGADNEFVSNPFHDRGARAFGYLEPNWFF